MMYGCIGEHLPHSFSAEIHRMIGRYDYALQEIAPEHLDAFMRARGFLGINVTIPYKQAVIPYLDTVSDTARAIGAVNTIVNRDGALHGYNTDFDGLTRLIARLGLNVRGKKALILGTGGTSKTALYALRALGAAQAIRVSRTGREGAITYQDAARLHADAQVILNTTPCGMYPRIDEAPISLAAFPQLEGVADAIYNPLRSRLILEARARGIKAAGGLYMLVAQAVRAAEIFTDTPCPDGLTDGIYGRLLRQKQNIALIGMPGSGKSTVAAELGFRLGREVIDTDRVIEAQAGRPIPEIFASEGEGYFRDLESRIIAGLAGRSGLILSTGGGAVLRAENVTALRQNSRLYWLDRPPEALLPTDDRPLADSREKIARLYQQRQPIYQSAADEIIPVAGTAREAAQEIESRWNTCASL